MHRPLCLINLFFISKKPKSNAGRRKKTLKKKNIEPIFGKVNEGDQIKNIRHISRKVNEGAEIKKTFDLF